MIISVLASWMPFKPKQLGRFGRRSLICIDIFPLWLIETPFASAHDDNKLDRSVASFININLKKKFSHLDKIINNFHINNNQTEYLCIFFTFVGTSRVHLLNTTAIANSIDKCDRLPVRWTFVQLRLGQIWPQEDAIYHQYAVGDFVGHDGDVEPRRSWTYVHSIAGGTLYHRHLHWVVQLAVGRLFSRDCTSIVARSHISTDLIDHRIGCVAHLHSWLFYSSEWIQRQRLYFGCL